MTYWLGSLLYVEGGGYKLGRVPKIVNLYNTYYLDSYWFYAYALSIVVQQQILNILNKVNMSTNQDSCWFHACALAIVYMLYLPAASS